MRVLVTGGAGFIGSHIVDAYIKKDCEVIVVDNLATGDRNNLNPQATFIYGDVTDKETFNHPLLAHPVDVVSHQAAHLDAVASVNKAEFDATANILGTINALEYASKKGASFILASTACIYGGCGEYPATEDCVHPTLPYGLSKLCAEKYVEMYSDLHNVNYNILRYGNVYGQRDPKSVTNKFLHWAEQGENLLIDGMGTQTRDYINVLDVARANVNASQVFKNDVYNVSTGKETSVLEIAEALVTPDRISFNKKANPGAPRCSMNPSKFKDNFNWEPIIEFKEYLQHETRNESQHIGF